MCGRTEQIQSATWFEALNQDRNKLRDSKRKEPFTQVTIKQNSSNSVILNARLDWNNALHAPENYPIAKINDTVLKQQSGRKTARQETERAEDKEGEETLTVHSRAVRLLSQEHLVPTRVHLSAQYGWFGQWGKTLKYTLSTPKGCILAH